MNNYTLNQCCKPSTPYRNPDAAIIIGQLGTRAFTVEMVEPEMAVCFWQPGMDKVAWSEYYKAWYEAQQKELGRVSG